MPAPLADVSVGYFIVSHPATGAELEMEAVTGARPVRHRPPPPAVHSRRSRWSNSSRSRVRPRTCAEIAVGDNVEVLCGMRNAGDETLHVSFMTGSLNNPYDFGDYLTNFSEVTVNRTIAPHSEISLDYTFNLPEFGVRVGPYIIALTVFYATGEGEDVLNYSHTFFNETVIATEAPASVDSKTFFTIAISLTVGFVFFHMSMKKKATQKAAKKNNFVDRDHEEEMQVNVSRHVRSTGGGGGGSSVRRKK